MCDAVCRHTEDDDGEGEDSHKAQKLNDVDAFSATTVLTTHNNSVRKL